MWQTDRRTDGQNYDSQDRPRICSRGKNECTCMHGVLHRYSSITAVSLSILGTALRQLWIWTIGVYNKPIRNFGLYELNEQIYRSVSRFSAFNFQWATAHQYVTHFRTFYSIACNNLFHDNLFYTLRFLIILLFLFLLHSSSSSSSLLLSSPSANVAVVMRSVASVCLFCSVLFGLQLLKHWPRNVIYGVHVHPENI